MKCTPGNKQCGKRCIPENYNCGAADAGADISNLETERKPGFISKKLNRGSQNKVTRRAAQDRLERMEREAVSLAGGEKEYRKELEQIIKNSGGGIKARIIRSSMNRLAPNLIKADDLNMYLTVKKRGRYEQQIYRRNRSKFKLSDVIRKGDRLKKGDIIRVRFGGPVAGGFGYHYGVYMGDGRVVQYGNQRLNPNTNKAEKTAEIGVYETNLKNINRKGGFKWEKVPGAGTKFSPEELEERISKVKDKKVRYNMMSNNCEHFAYLLTQGKAYSSQADVSEGITGGVVKTLFHYIQRQRRVKAGFKHNEFTRLDQFAFSEKRKPKKKKSQTRGTWYDSSFRLPKNIRDVEKDLMTATQFAEETSGGKSTIQVGILAGWLREYVENIAIATS
jgi:hypothetical protein